MSLVERLIRNASFSVLAGLTSAVGAFVSAAIVARTLGVNGTASVAIALWIVFLVVTLSDVGVTASLARFMPSEAEAGSKDRLRTFVWSRFRYLLMFMGAGLLLLAVALSFYWSNIVQNYASSSQEAYLICGLIALCFVVHMLFAFSYQYLRGSSNFRAISGHTLSGSILQVGGVWFGSQQFGVVGALGAYLLASLPMLWVLSRLRGTHDAPRPKLALAVRRYAISFYFAALLSPLLWVRADLFLVDQIASARAVGLFAAASTFAALLIQVCQMICNALLPSILQAAADDPKSLPEISQTTTRFGMFILLPACFIGAALAPNATQLVYGAAFREAGPTAALLGCAAAASAITLVLTGVLNAADANRALVKSGIVGAVLTVLLGISLISHFGLIGAALGRIGAQTVVAALNIIEANRVLPNLIRLGWFSRYLGASLIAGGSTWMMSGDGLINLLLGGMTGALTFVAITVLTLRFVTDDHRTLFRSIAGQPQWLRRAAGILVGQPKQ